MEGGPLQHRRRRAWRRRFASFDEPRHDRMIWTVVRPTDGLVIGRAVVIGLLALMMLGADPGSSSMLAACLIAVLAAAQPLIALVWPLREPFRQARLATDIVVYTIFVAHVPQYYWLCTLVLIAVLSHHAVLAPLRHYVPSAAVSMVVIGVLGEVHDIERHQRATAVMVLLCVGFGIAGYRTRASLSAARGDLLIAIRAARGLAHVTDLGAGVIEVSGDTEHVVGWPRDVWLTIDHSRLIHPDDLEDYWIRPEDAVPGAVVDRTARIRTSDGQWIWLRDISRVVMHRNRPYLRGFCLDVTSERAGLHKVSAEASTDSLTGLRNRRWLLAELGLREHQVGHYLIVMDLNRFKEVNDTLGHEAGDELLEVVADRLSACLRPGDVLARLGGDEFAVILDGMTDSTSVVAAVDRFALEVARPVEINGVRLTTSVSAGIVEAVRHGASSSAMLRHADIAMYRAKRLRQTSALFDDEMAEEFERQSALSAALPDALASDELALHFQPIVEIATGRTVGVEGLARWDHEVFGLLRPAAFLDVVLMSDRAGAFTRSMVRHAIDAASRLDLAGFDLSVSVNLPIRALEDPDFERWFVEQCEATGVEPRQLVFEIAEQDIHDTASITSAIDRFAALGVTISVDDFGSGHATFERLRWGNVDQLKLDSDVLRDATSDPREREILRSVLSLAERLGYTVVAEGLETEAQLELLREFGCPLAQGYLLAAPMPFDELLIALCEQHAAQRVDDEVSTR